MTPDEGQQAWREAVRAFRLAAAVLENPALFADLTGPEILRDLGREPALVHISPFDALPNDIAYDRSEPVRQSTGRPGGITGRPPERGTARSRDGRTRAARPPDGPESVPQAVSSGSGESVIEQPSFSFRRSGASGASSEQRQPSRRDRDVREETIAKSSTSSADFHGPGSTRREREEPTAEEAHPDRDARAYSGATTDRRDVEIGVGASDLMPGEHGPIHPMTLLNGLAEDALRAAEPRAQEGPVRPDGFREPGRAASHHPGIGDHAPNEPVLEAYGNGAAALIGSLADRLLAPEARAFGSPPAPEARGDEETGSVAARPWEQPIPNHSPLAYSGGADEESAGRPDADPIAEATSDRHMDAEAFAALVNDVLIRQARRHGVDLS